MVSPKLLFLIEKQFRVTFDTTATGNIRVIISHPKVRDPGVFVGNEKQVNESVRIWLKSLLAK